MSLRKTLLKQVLAWVETQLGLTGSGASPTVILAQRGEKSPRPSLPYIVLRFTTFDIPVGTAESRYTEDTLNIGAHRQASLEIRGIGPESEDWLQELQLRLDTFTGDMAITTVGSGGILDASVLVHESLEEQYILELLCEYHIRGTDTVPTAQQSTLITGDTAETFTITTVIDWE